MRPAKRCGTPGGVALAVCTENSIRARRRTSDYPPPECPRCSDKLRAFGKGKQPLVRMAICAIRESIMPSRLFGIHQHEQNPTRRRAAIDPGVIGRLLDHDIARLHVHFRHGRLRLQFSMEDPDGLHNHCQPP